MLCFSPSSRSPLCVLFRCWPVMGNLYGARGQFRWLQQCGFEEWAARVNIVHSLNDFSTRRCEEMVFFIGYFPETCLRGEELEKVFSLLLAASCSCYLLKSLRYPCTCTCVSVSVKTCMYNLVSYPFAASFRVCPVSKNIPRVFVFIYCEQFEQNSPFRSFLVQATAVLSL